MLFCEHEGTLTSSVSLCIGLWGRHREGGTRDLGQKRRSRQQSISCLQGRHTQWVRQCEEILLGVHLESTSQLYVEENLNASFSFFSYVFET